jgi:hypothetical protein
VDNSQGRLNYELKGQFLDYVAYSSVLYGGGKMQVDSVQLIVNPITMLTSRPSIYNNFITLSEDSAISADPDSFEETTLSAPAFQAVSFTPDFSRIGPDLYGNRLINNSGNGLFVRIQTAAGEPTRQMTVAGRFDDKDIVHVISENLVIRGTPGGPFLEVNAPPVVLVTLTPQSGGTLGVGTYNYRIVYVDASGNQSPPSLVTRSGNNCHREQLHFPWQPASGISALHFSPHLSLYRHRSRAVHADRESERVFHHLRRQWHDSHGYP